MNEVSTAVMIHMAENAGNGGMILFDLQKIYILAGVFVIASVFIYGVIKYFAKKIYDSITEDEDQPPYFK